MRSERRTSKGSYEDKPMVDNNAENRTGKLAKWANERRYTVSLQSFRQACGLEKTKKGFCGLLGLRWAMPVNLIIPSMLY